METAIKLDSSPQKGRATTGSRPILETVIGAAYPLKTLRLTLETPS